MNRWLLIIGFVVASFLMMRIYEGEITTEAVINEMGVGGAEPAQPAELDTADSSITVMAFGDMMMGRYVRTLMDRNGKDYIFAHLDMIEGPFYDEADLVFGNLEGPIKGEGYPSQTSMVFGFHEDTAAFLKSYGFDVFSIANNHALDQKWEGRDTTIAALEAQELGWCGHPNEADIESVYYKEIDGKIFGMICLNHVIYPTDKNDAIELVKTISGNVDYLIVTPHWGSEYVHQPSQTAQVDFAHKLIDSGADFIIGHHPHVVQTFEEYNGRYIFYSLGNFIFDQYWSRETQEELAIKISFENGDDGVKSTTVELFPMVSEKSQPRLMREEEKDKWIEKFISYGEYSEKEIAQIRVGVLNISR